MPTMWRTCVYIYMYMHVWVIRAPTRWLHCRRFAQSDTQVIDCTKPIHMLAEFISRISTLVVGFISCRTSTTIRNQHVRIGVPCLPKRLVWRDMELSLHAKLRAPFQISMQLVGIPWSPHARLFATSALKCFKRGCAKR